MKSPLVRLELDRRGFLKGLGALGAAAWSSSPARAFALPEDKIKVVHYFTTPGDEQGRQGQPMVNQSANVVMIETERGLVGIGEGGEPRTISHFRHRPVLSPNPSQTVSIPVVRPRPKSSNPHSKHSISDTAPFK